MTTEPGGAYTFGTNPTAAERLLLLARVFDPTMAAVLAELPRRSWRRVVDLGCGPASSTERLAAHLDVAELVGVDASADFCAEAARRLPTARFVTGDVLAPLPGPAPDLVYARFVLSHLPEPLAVARRWADQLAPDGMVVLEEPERIDTDDDVLRSYLALTGAVVASRGAAMFVGPTLAALDGPVNRVLELPVDGRDAARMFSLNLASVRLDPWAQDRHTVAELDALAAALAARTTAPGPVVGWHIRQVVLAAA